MCVLVVVDVVNRVSPDDVVDGVALLSRVVVVVFFLVLLSRSRVLDCVAGNVVVVAVVGVVAILV